jgi:hypothetical protein
LGGKRPSHKSHLPDNLFQSQWGSSESTVRKTVGSFGLKEVADRLPLEKQWLKTTRRDLTMKLK